MAVTHPHVLGLHGAVTTDSVTLEERTGKFIYFSDPVDGLRVATSIYLMCSAPLLFNGCLGLVMRGGGKGRGRRKNLVEN